MRAKPRILIVEDDDEFRQVAAGLLEDAGYLVTTASNGRDALDLLVNGPDTPDLILLDLRMPVMDGWEFARVIRCYRRLAEVPIIVISTPGPAAGWHPSVDAVLPKPFSPRALIDEVEKHAPVEFSPTPSH